MPQVDTPSARELRAQRRVSRRETHSSRALSAVVVALIVLAGCGYLAAEVIASLAGRRILADAPTMWHAVWHAPDLWDARIAIVAGVLAMLLGLIVLIKAVAPGRLARHCVEDERSAIVVDDAVLAAGISRSVRERFALEKSQVSTTVARSRVDVHVTPTSGVALDEDALRTHVARHLEAIGTKPRLRSRIHLRATGVVAP